jgi:mannose-1-phosphate guanylyltransferase
MAGGSGTRFWPRSRARLPKQLLALWDEKTLIEHTVERFKGVAKPDAVWIVTTEALAAPTREKLGAAHGKVRILGEPVGKNTAPCILWGVREISKIAPDAVIAVMPADHFIGDEPAFRGALSAAASRAAKAGSLVTLGIRPNRPETGYGYIEVSAKIGNEPLAVSQFVEKPDLRTAARYLESGRFLWNAGMFIFTAKAGMEAFSRAMPGLVGAFEKGGSIADVYGRIAKADAVSFDYGVMERAASLGIGVDVVPAACGWNDVGSFPALEEIGRASRGEVVSVDSASNIVQTDSGFVALLGVTDLVVVRDGEVTLVAARDRAQDVKALLEKVRARFPGSV